MPSSASQGNNGYGSDAATAIRYSSIEAVRESLCDRCGYRLFMLGFQRRRKTRTVSLEQSDDHRRIAGHELGLGPTCGEHGVSDDRAITVTLGSTDRCRPPCQFIQNALILCAITRNRQRESLALDSLRRRILT